MTIDDIGPRPGAFDIESETKENSNYRTVAWTGKYLQVTLMSIEPGASIGLEVHPDTDQFLRLDAGSGTCVMGPAKDNLDFEQEVSDGWAPVCHLCAGSPCAGVEAGNRRGRRAGRGRWHGRSAGMVHPAAAAAGAGRTRVMD